MADTLIYTDLQDFIRASPHPLRSGMRLEKVTFCSAFDEKMRFAHAKTVSVTGCKSHKTYSQKKVFEHNYFLSDFEIFYYFIILF